MTRRSTNQTVVPLQTAGTQHLIERTYREGGTFQWARESVVNALEAQAKRVHLGVEWQGVSAKGVFRRIIADDGTGMTGDQLKAFFGTFGGGGKPIGGVHENFGVGSKTSLMPWNKYGLVVVSWVNDVSSMIWIKQDKASGEYGLRVYDAAAPGGEITRETVIEPYMDTEHGIDWRQVKPEWMGPNGTVIVLMGNSPKEDTIIGDPSREEADLKGLASYLNRRIWDIPEGVNLTVEEFRTSDRALWPRSEAEGHGRIPDVGADRRTVVRTIRGAKYYIEYPNSQFSKGKLGAHGEMQLKDGTCASWYLWEGDRPNVQSYASYQGFIGALYKNELYDVAAHHAAYRAFGISDQTVRQRVWIVLTPKPFDERARRGVYPRTDRNALLMAGGPEAGAPLPMHAWSAEFSERMPEEIREALRLARPTEAGSLDDSARDKLVERFGDRWRIPRIRVQRGGHEPVDPNQPAGVVGATVHRKPRHEEPTEAGERKDSPVGLHGENRLGHDAGEKRGVRALVGGGVPTYRTVHQEDLEPGIIASWQPHDPSHPEGVVLVNRDHPVMVAQISYYQAQFPDHLAEDIAWEVLDIYGWVLVAKVAHSEKLKGILPSDVVDREMRSDAALTMSALGLLAEDQVIAAKLSGRFGKKKLHSAEAA